MTPENAYVDDLLTDDEISALLDAVQPRNSIDRRREVRHPFIVPITIHQLQDAGKQISACSREISQSGIGLLHNMNVDRGTNCVLYLEFQGIKFCKFATVQWCRCLADDWYFSGWRFVLPDGTPTQKPRPSDL